MPPKQKKRAVTTADMDRVLATLQPTMSGKDMARFAKQDETERTKFITAKRKIAKSRTPTQKEKKAASDAADLAANRGKNATDETKKSLAGVERTQADQLALTGEKPKKKGESWINRTFDVLSRGQFGAAEAVRRAGTLDDDKFWDFGAGVQGFKEGITGKKKTSFSDVLKEHGNTGKGMGTLGFALDVFADPTTYVGAGLVGKAGKASKEVKEALESSARVIDKVTAVDKGVAPAAVQKAVAAERIPVENLRRRDLKKLSDPAKVLAEQVKIERGIIGKQKRNLVAKPFTGNTIDESGRRSFADFSGIEDVNVRKMAEETFAAEIKKSPGMYRSLKNFRAGFLPDGVLGMAYGPDMLPTRAGRGRITTNLNVPRFIKHFGLDKVKPQGEFSVASRNVPDVAKATIIHEMGHHAVWSIPKAERDAIFATLQKDHGFDFLGKAGRSPLSDEGKDFIRKNLGDYAATNQEELFAEAWTEWRVMGDKARPLSKQVAQAVEKHITKAAPDKNAQQLIESLADDAHTASKEHFTSQVEEEFRKAGRRFENLNDYDRGQPITKADRALADEINVEAARRAGEAGVLDKGALRAELMDNAGRNLDTKTKKQLALRVGGAKFAIPGVAAVVGKTADALGSPAFVQKTVKGFNDAFRAKAFIPESLRHLRTQINSTGVNLMRAQGYEIKSVWDKVPKSARREIGKAWAKGETKGIAAAGGISGKTGQPVDNVMDYLDAGMQDLHVKILNLAQSEGLTASDFNSFLDKKYHMIDVLKENVGPASDSMTRNKYKPDFFLDQIKGLISNGKVDDPAQALYAYGIAVNQAIAKRQLWTTMGEIHGATISKAGTHGKGAAYDRMMEQGAKGSKYETGTRFGDNLVKTQGWKPAMYQGKVIRGLEDQVFEPEVADAIGRMADVFSSGKSTGKYLDVYDKTLMGIKSILTRYNPAFTPRTLMGEMLLGQLGGMKNLPASYAMSMKILRGRNREFLGRGAAENGGDASRNLINSDNLRRGVTAEQFQAGGSRVVMRHKKFGSINADTFWHHYQNSGLKSGFASTDMVRGTDATVGGSVLRKISDGSQNLNESVEDIGRLAHFVDAIRYSKANTLEEAIADAAMVVRKTHLDYTEVTGFEKNAMARVIPFYKWLRLSTPLMAEILLTQPGKAMVLPKALDFASRAAGYDPENSGVFPGGPDAAVPDYLLDSGSQPVGSIGKNTQWFNPESLNPVVGSVNLLQGLATDPLAQIMDVSNPLLALIPELALNKQNSGAPPRDDLAKYGASQTPQTNYVRKALGGGDADVSQTENLLKFLGNVGFQSNTPTTIQSAAGRQKVEADDQRREAKRRAGILEPKK